ncbi:MAG TPA: sigma-70 family RNA polymerase sigma factor [Melioribacteraceae bacterium]|nr:sigma-70 family RNA polymerase sigma factor [Melioribacteraceae bacterium]
MNNTHNLRLTESEKQKHYDFETLAVPHKEALYNFALKMTNDTDEADDLLQETFLKAFKYFDKFERGTNCKAWLYSIMRNTYINEYRRIQKSPTKVDYDDIQNFYENIKETEVEYGHIVEDTFSNTLNDEVTEALSELPKDFQTIILLSDVEGFTYEEIADFLSCPIGTVRSRLHRARKMLYAKLYDYAKNTGYVEK